MREFVLNASNASALTWYTASPVSSPDITFLLFLNYIYFFFALFPHLVQVSWRGWRRPSLVFGQLLLLVLPLFLTVWDVDGDAPSAKIAAADVAGDGHCLRSPGSQEAC